MSNYSIAGFEALIRWRSPVLGFVNPGDFIPAAEDSGLIVPIGLWVLEHSCHMLQRFQARLERCFPDLPPLFMSANVSACQLREMKDVGKHFLAHQGHGTEAEHLKLEITEGILVEDPEVASAVLEKLKQIGVSFAIDDFGTAIRVSAISTGIPGYPEDRPLVRELHVEQHQQSKDRAGDHHPGA